MADFQVNVVRVDAIEPMVGADRIELAVIGGYRSIVQKGAFKPGDLAVYLPEQSVLPDWLIIKLNLVGKLSGSKQNRIKAIKLKGYLSQGILYPAKTINTYTQNSYGCVYAVVEKFNSAADALAADEQIEAPEGDDVAEFLGITKFDPTTHMSHEQRQKFYGNCVNIYGNTVKYDLENWKKHSSAFEEGDEVVITEKLHGTMCCFAYYPGLDHPELPDDVFVYSKGLGAGGNVFKWPAEGEAENVYLKAFRSFTNDQNLEPTIIGRVWENLMDVWHYEPGSPVFLFGEVHGANVQDLNYGIDTPQFRAFDVWIGTPQEGGFMDAKDKLLLFRDAGVPHVPVLFSGPFHLPKMLELTDGKTTLGEGHVREGIVITSLREEHVHRLGRKALKNVSGDYLLRRDGTEFA